MQAWRAIKEKDGILGRSLRAIFIVPKKNGLIYYGRLSSCDWQF